MRQKCTIVQKVSQRRTRICYNICAVIEEPRENREMKSVRIAGTGSYLPPRVVANAEIAERLCSSSEWILSHTGVASRHVAGATESASTMGTAAASSALMSAGVSPTEIGLVIVATSTPDYGSYPSTACLVQAELGCVNAAAFDLAAACSGFMYALEMAKGYLLCHPDEKALVIGTEVLSRQIDWSDRTNAMLFGDGAGAVVLDLAEASAGVSGAASLLGADGRGARAIHREAGYRYPLCADPVHETAKSTEVNYLKMDGHAVFAFAVRKLDEIIRMLCAKAGMSPDSLDLVIPHQANLRIIEAVARRMGLPQSRFYVNLRDVGNTSSASIPLCLDQAVRDGVLEAGMALAMAGFGSGLTWAGALSIWPYL